MSSLDLEQIFVAKRKVEIIITKLHNNKSCHILQLLLKCILTTPKLTFNNVKEIRFLSINNPIALIIFKSILRIFEVLYIFTQQEKNHLLEQKMSSFWLKLCEIGIWIFWGTGTEKWEKLNVVVTYLHVVCFTKFHLEMELMWKWFLPQVYTCNLPVDHHTSWILDTQAGCWHRQQQIIVISVLIWEYILPQISFWWWGWTV